MTSWFSWQLWNNHALIMITRGCFLIFSNLYELKVGNFLLSILQNLKLENLPLWHCFVVSSKISCMRSLFTLDWINLELLETLATWDSPLQIYWTGCVTVWWIYPKLQNGSWDVNSFFLLIVTNLTPTPHSPSFLLQTFGNFSIQVCCQMFSVLGMVDSHVSSVVEISQRKNCCQICRRCASPVSFRPKKFGRFVRAPRRWQKGNLKVPTDGRTDLRSDRGRC